MNRPFCDAVGLRWRFERAATDSATQARRYRRPARIYAHKDQLLTLAFSLVHDMNTAEDILHDVFVSFAGPASELKLRTSLRGT